MVLFCSLSAFADDSYIDDSDDFKYFNFTCQRPSADLYNGYVEIVYYHPNSDGSVTWYPFLLVLHAFPNKFTSEHNPDAYVSKDGISLRVQLNNYLSPSDYVSYCYTVYSPLDVDIEFPSFYSGNQYNNLKYFYVPSESVISQYGLRLYSIKSYGFVQNQTENVYNDCIFNYGSEAGFYELLIDIYESIQNLSIASGTSSPAFDSSVLVSLSESLSNIENLLSEQNPDISDVASDVANIKSYLNTLKSTVSTISTNLNTVKNTTTTINTHLFACKNNLDTLLTNINSLYTRLGNVLDELRSLGADVEDILEWMDTFYTQFQRIRNQLTEIDQKLYDILEVLRGNPSVTVTGPDTSKMDEYYNVENSLLNNPDVNPSEALKIEYNQNAFSFIWQEVTRAISNPKVFGTVLTVLSLGLVCLIFGRKV